MPADETPSKTLASLLRARIESGELQPGDRLPSERALAEKYRIARNTAAAAIRILAESGLVSRHHGRGNFVKGEQPLIRLGNDRYSPITVADDDPAVYRRRLRTELRNLRRAARFTQKDVAESLEWSPSKMLRIESGASNIGSTDLRVLLAHYGVKDEVTVAGFIDLGRAARRRTWRDSHRPHIDPQFFAFLEYEAAAASIRQFQSTVVPGLLQTEDYMRTLFESFYGDPFYGDLQKLERVVEIRLTRQRRLIGQLNGPEMVFLLDESVFRHRVGRWDVMRRQSERILELAHRPNITVRLVPFDAGQHFGMRGSFIVFSLSEDASERVVVLEDPTRDVLIRDEPGEIARYSNGFAEIASRSLSAVNSIRRVNELLEEMSPSDS